MIELSRQQIYCIRSTFRQALGRSSSRRTIPITFEGTPQELRIRAVSDRVAIEHRVPGRFPTIAFAIPFEALAACEGRREDLVRFELADGQVTLHWTDANIPQTVRFPTVEPVALPEPPSEFASIERTFLAAMADACATTDAESQRYALSCVRLRGADSQIAATDGQQALVQTGFTFPWTDDVLVPATGAFVAKAIRAAVDVCRRHQDGQPGRGNAPGRLGPKTDQPYAARDGEGLFRHRSRKFLSRTVAHGLPDLPVS